HVTDERRQLFQAVLRSEGTAPAPAPARLGRPARQDGLTFDGFLQCMVRVAVGAFANPNRFGDQVRSLRCCCGGGGGGGGSSGGSGGGSSCGGGGGGGGAGVRVGEVFTAASAASIRNGSTRDTSGAARTAAEGVGSVGRAGSSSGGRPAGRGGGSDGRDGPAAADRAVLALRAEAGV
ncbi:MAG: hypothetical protein ACK4F6_19450, partial [Hylemonella sp.]